MEKLEFYFFEEFVASNERSKRRYYVHSVHGETGIYVNFIEDVIAEKINGLFCKVAGEYLFDKVVIYSSLNKDVEGKPHVEITRQGTIVRGATGKSDLLHRLNEEILSVLEEKAKES